MTSDATTVSKCISRALSDWVSKGTIAIVVDAKGGVGAGLTNESSRAKAEGISVGIALAVGTLRRPVAVGDSASPVTGNAAAIAITIGISVSITLANGMSECTNTIMMETKDGETGAGLTDESTCTQS